jgi:hypothetical protein
MQVKTNTSVANSTVSQTSNFFFGKLFFILLLSSLLFTTLFAIWKTEGKTILSLGLLLFFLLHKHLHFSIRQNYTTYKLKILLSCIFLIVCIIPNALTICSFEQKFIYYIPTQDLVGYSNYVKMLLETGQENYNGFSANYFDNYFHGVSPYHFYEFWLAAFICQLTGFQALIAYWIVVYPFFYFLTFCGFMAVIETYHLRTTNKQLCFDALFSFLLLFVGAIYFPLYALIPYLDSIFYLHNNTILTYGLIEPFLLASFILYRQKKYYLAWFFLLLLPIFSITTWVGVFALLLFLCITKPEQGKIIKKLIYSFILLTILIILFYYFFGTQNKATFSWQELLPIFAWQTMDWRSFYSFLGKTFLLVFGLYLSKTVVAYFPFVSLCLLYLKKNRISQKINFRYLLGLSSLIFVPISAMFLLFLHHDSSQVFRNFLFPLCNIAIAICLIQHSKQLFARQNYLFISCLILLVYQIGFSIYFRISQIQERQIYSLEYLQKIETIAKTELSGKFGAFIYGKSFYTDDLFSKVVRHQLPAGYLAVIPFFHSIVNIEIFSIPMSKNPNYTIFENRFRQNSEFFQFVKRQKHAKTFQNITQSQIDFIVQNQIGFLIIGKNITLPKNYLPLIKKEIIDQQSGEKFLILHHK